MRNEPQIFTKISRQDVPVSLDVEDELIDGLQIAERKEKLARRLIEDTRRISLDGNFLNVEVAATPQTRSQGLMHREKMGCAGMLFVMDGKSAAFHMKNTHIPLDIVFFNESGSAIKLDQMKPLTGRSQCDHAVSHVLELPAGTCKKMGIKKGSRLTVESRGEGLLRQIVIESLQ